MQVRRRRHLAAVVAALFAAQGARRTAILSARYRF
jgi:hypothetical protein